jgi:hypothetical protein
MGRRRWRILQFAFGACTKPKNVKATKASPECCVTAGALALPDAHVTLLAAS